MTVRILQFGTTGQLARELLAQARDFDVQITALSRAEADFADPQAVADAVKAHPADLVVIAGNPLADIRHTRDIHRVIHAGRVLDPAELLRQVPVR